MTPEVACLVTIREGMLCGVLHAAGSRDACSGMQVCCVHAVAFEVSQDRAIAVVLAAASASACRFGDCVVDVILSVLWTR